MNARLIAEVQSVASSSHVRVGWEWYEWTWRPRGGFGRAGWGQYLGFRWLGFVLSVQRFASAGPT